MASCLLAADVGTNAQAYFDNYSSVEGTVDYLFRVGEGPLNTISQLGQNRITEDVAGNPVDKLVGYITTGQVACDYLTVNPNALAARSIATASLTAGTVTINTSAADPQCFIFLTPYSSGTLTEPLRVSAITTTSFTVTAGATDTCDFAWWIVNPNYSS